MAPLLDTAGYPDLDTEFTEFHHTEFTEFHQTEFTAFHHTEFTAFHHSPSPPLFSPPPTRSSGRFRVPSRFRTNPPVVLS